MIWKKKNCGDKVKYRVHVGFINKVQAFMKHRYCKLIYSVIFPKVIHRQE